MDAPLTAPGPPRRWRYAPSDLPLTIRLRTTELPPYQSQAEVNGCLLLNLSPMDICHFNTAKDYCLDQFVHGLKEKYAKHVRTLPPLDVGVQIALAYRPSVPGTLNTSKHGFDVPSRPRFRGALRCFGFWRACHEERPLGVLWTDALSLGP